MTARQQERQFSGPSNGAASPWIFVDSGGQLAPQPQIVRGQMSSNETALIRGAMRRDPEAFKDLVHQYHRVVLGMVYRLIAPRTPQDAEDHAQEIFVKLSRTISTFDFEKQTKFSTWFHTFVRNYCFDTMRKRRLRTVSLSPRNEDGPPAIDPRETGAGPEERSQRGEFRLLLNAAIQSLPEPEREVFLMRELEGREYSDIAKELRIAEGTAKGRLYRAKESLRIKLAPYLRSGSLDGFPSPATESHETLTAAEE